MSTYQGRLSDLVGKRVLVSTGRGVEEGVARRIAIGGDEQWLIVDLDRERDGIGYRIHPDHVIGPVVTRRA